MSKIIEEKFFVESVYEIAFGDDAFNKDYTNHEVLKELRRFCEESHKWETRHDDKTEEELIEE